MRSQLSAQLVPALATLMLFTSVGAEAQGTQQTRCSQGTLRASQIQDAERSRWACTRMARALRLDSAPVCAMSALFSSQWATCEEEHQRAVVSESLTAAHCRLNASSLRPFSSNFDSLFTCLEPGRGPMVNYTSANYVELLRMQRINKILSVFPSELRTLPALSEVLAACPQYSDSVQNFYQTTPRQPPSESPAEPDHWNQRLLNAENLLRQIPLTQDSQQVATCQEGGVGDASADPIAPGQACAYVQVPRHPQAPAQLRTLLATESHRHGCC